MHLCAPDQPQGLQGRRPERCAYLSPNRPTYCSANLPATPDSQTCALWQFVQLRATSHGMHLYAAVMHSKTCMAAGTHLQ